ncbi:MAG: hypothetical protein JWN70_5861 [Planctomycetaceae bacterium]|nr:hypothetical protein [Planctomycetaceae bacterium]
MSVKQHAVRSGPSYWKATGPEPIECPCLEGHVTCEAAVVGAGITGALVSDMLIQSGVDTVLVDRGAVGAGSTAASTGLLLYEIDKPLIELIQHVGERHAVHAYRRGVTAILELEELTSELGPQCDFVRRNALYLASEPLDFIDLTSEHQCRQHFGFNVSLLSAEGLKTLCGLQAHGALYSTGDAEVNPYSLTHSLVTRAQKNGLRAFAETRVIQTDDVAGGVKLQTDAGLIEAKQVVFATGYFAAPILSSASAELLTSYVVTSQPLPRIDRWPDDCLIWETADPYFYLRRTADGRAMIGGEDTPYSKDHQDDQLLSEKAERLAKRFRTMFPGSDFQPEYVWGGTFAETKDGLPFIGRAVGHDRIYHALGYGGNGITFSMIAARLIRDLILRRPNDDADVFRFGR